MQKRKTIVVNLIAGPGAGKSTTAAGLFYNLKCLGYDVELALEFAKNKVWEESFRTLDDQVYIFAKQFHKIWRLNEKVDVIITDSPLLLSIYYNKKKSLYFDDFVHEQANKFRNLYFCIERGDNYIQNGRLQTEEEAKAIDNALLEIINRYNEFVISVPQDDAVSKIMATLKIILEEAATNEQKIQ